MLLRQRLHHLQQAVHLPAFRKGIGTIVAVVVVVVVVVVVILTHRNIKSVVVEEYPRDKNPKPMNAWRD